MIRLRPLIMFLLPLAVVYTILMVPWPGVRGAYASAFQGVANFTFGSMGESTMFGPNQTSATAADTQVVLRKRVRIGDREVVLRGEMAFNARTRYLKPFAAVLALTLSTPIVWSRRWKAVLAATIVIHAVLALQLWLLLATSYATVGPDVSEFARGVHRVVEDFANRSLTVPFIIAVLVWLAVTFRREDWQRLRRLTVGGPEAGDPEPGA